MIHGLIRCHVERVFDASYIGFVGTCYVKVRRLNKDGTNRGYVTDLWCMEVGKCTNQKHLESTARRSTYQREVAVMMCLAIVARRSDETLT